MKRILLVVPFIIIVALGALLVVPSFLDWNSYKGQVQSQIKEFTGYDVDLKGDLAFSFLPEPTLYIEEAQLSAGEGVFASFARLDVHISPVPLLSGALVVRSIGLVKPAFSLRVSGSGAQNWMTPKLQAVMSGRGRSSQSGSGLLRSISLQNISIEQGRFRYVDDRGASAIEIDQIDLDIQASTLQGPFNVEGSVVYAGSPLAIKAAVGALTPGAQSISLSARLGYNGFDIRYAGALGLVAPFESQGEAVIEVGALSQALQKYGAPAFRFEKDSGVFKGLVSASTAGVLFKNASVDLAGQSLALDFSLQRAPLSINAKILSKKPFDLAPFMSQTQKKEGKKAFDITSFLPKKMPLPKALEANISVDLPGVMIAGQNMGPVDLNIYKKASRLLFGLKLNQMPGQGQANLDAALDFSNGPVLSLSGTGKTAHLSETLKALSGQDIAFAQGVKSASTAFDVFLVPGKLQFEKTSITLDDQTYMLSGLLEGQNLLMNLEGYGGRLNLQTSIKNGGFFKNAAVQVKHPNLARAVQQITKASAPNPALSRAIDVYAKVNQKGGSFKLSDVKATLGDVSLSGSLGYDGGSGKPAVSGDFKVETLDLTQGHDSPKSGNKSAKDARGDASARWSKDPIDVSWLGFVDVDLNIEVDRLLYGAWDLEKPKLDLKIKDGALEIKKLEAGLHGGSVLLKAVLKGMETGSGVALNGSIKVSDISFAPMVESLVGRRLLKGSGTLNMQSTLSSEGRTQAQLISSLGGDGTLDGADFILEGFDLSRFARALSDEVKAGDTLLGVWKTASKGGNTVFDRLDGAFAIEKGIVNITKLDLESATIGLSTQGSVDLPKWYIKTAHSVVLKDNQDVPPFVIEIEGSLDNPAQTFGQGALQDYLTRKLNRKLEKMLTKKLGNDELGRAMGGALQTLMGVYSGSGGAKRAAGQQKIKQREEQREKLGEAGEEAPEAPDDKIITPQETFNHLLEGLIQ